MPTLLPDCAVPDETSGVRASALPGTHPDTKDSGPPPDRSTAGGGTGRGARQAWKQSGRSQRRRHYPVSLPFAPPPHWAAARRRGRAWPVLAVALLFAFLLGAAVVALVPRPGRSLPPPGEGVASATAAPRDEATCGETQLEQAAAAPTPPADAPATDGPAPVAPLSADKPADDAGPLPDPGPEPVALLRPGRPPQCKAPGGGCARANYGTSVDFLDDPPAAAQQALKDKKLLFVLHVAGNFEDDKFT